MTERLSVDLGHLLNEEDTANFLSPIALETLSERNAAAFEEVRASLESGTSPMARSFDVEPSLPAIRALADSLRDRYENVLVLGIGGSTLGFRTILQALKGPYYNLPAPPRPTPRVFVLDNVDPVPAHQLGEMLDFGKTALVYVSKSGSTPESAANFLYFYRKYREAGGDPRDLAIICDPGDNGINRIARGTGAHLLHIPPDLGGRYSVLSAAGLLPAEVIGVDGQELLAGAAEVHRSIVGDPLERNAVFALGNCLAALGGRCRPIHVLFNYGSSLSEFGLWFVQLWAESLGKARSLSGETVNTGTTPLAALGATDQHSVLQLFNEGPNDKLFGFVTVDRFPEDVALTDEFPSEVEYSYFAGHTLSEQLKTEQISTETTLVRAHRPCYRLELADLSASSLGALFYFWEAVVVYVAKLWRVNPFDQPGVEEGKNMTYALMGRRDRAAQRPQYEAELAAFNRQSRRYSV